MSPLLPIYLAALRKQWGLSQKELADLLLQTPSGLSRIEARERRPSLYVVIGAEVVFGRSTKTVFPALYGEVEDRVMAQAKALYATLEGRSDLSVEDKLRLLEDMIVRAEANDFGL